MSEVAVNSLSCPAGGCDGSLSETKNRYRFGCVPRVIMYVCGSCHGEFWAPRPYARPCRDCGEPQYAVPKPVENVHSNLDMWFEWCGCSCTAGSIDVAEADPV